MNRTRLAVAVGLTLGLGAPAADGPGAKVPDRWWADERPRVDPSAPYARDVRLSADGKRLVVGWGPGVRLWDLASGRSLALHKDTERWVYTPRFSPDGRWVAGNRGAEPDWQVVVWDAATGKETWAEPAVTRKPAEYWRQAILGFDRDGGLWVARPAGVAERLEVPSGKVTRTVKLPFTAGAWGRLVLSPDGRRLALGGGTVFAVRSTAADADWVVIERHEEPPSEDLPQPTRCPVPCGFSPDGKRLVTYDRVGKVVALWDLGGDRPAKVTSRKDELTPWTHLDDLTFTPDGKRFAFMFTRRPLSEERTAAELRVWDAETLAEVSRVAPPVGVDGFAFTTDGKRVLMTHPDGGLTVRELDAGK